MSSQLKISRHSFFKSFGGKAARAIALKLRVDLKAPSLFEEFVYNNTFEFVISGLPNNFSDLRKRMVDIEEKNAATTASVINAVMSSTLFQRHSIVITVEDLMQQLRGQLFAFSYEVHHVEDGVNSMTTILFANETSDTSNYLDITGLKNLVTSHVMVFGGSLMLLSAGFFMLMGCIGDIYLCRSQRSYYQGDSDPLKDLTISLLMNATENRHYVMKLLKYSLVEQHCKQHVGIGSLAGIKPKDLEAALDKIVEFQTDLVHQYKIDIRSLIEEVTARWKVVQGFKEQFEKADLKYADNQEAYDNLTNLFSNDERLFNYVTYNISKFEDTIKQTFLDFTIDECDSLKNNISSYIDEFDNIGDCTTIMAIFSDGFNILCNGMIDFVNGYWLSIMILVGIYVYGIYISLTASKYLYTMKSYTYEGEAVPPGTKFEDLQTHKKQKSRKKVASSAGTLNEDERLRSEDAERMRQIRLRKAMMAPDTQLKYLVPLSPTVKPSGSNGDI
ncbi:hypothetical protein MTO96_005348 [Rhipicephalus appendiculatus]